MDEGNNLSGYTATEDELVRVLSEFVEVVDHPISGDLLMRDRDHADELEERIEALMKENSDLMFEAEDWMKMQDVSLRGKSEADVIWFIREHYGSGLVDFYMENRRAMSKKL